jgi:hypothetical protein
VEGKCKGTKIIKWMCKGTKIMEGEYKGTRKKCKGKEGSVKE